MRRSTLVAVIAFCLLGWPVPPQAQNFNPELLKLDVTQERGHGG